MRAADKRGALSCVYVNFAAKLILYIELSFIFHYHPFLKIVRSTFFFIIRVITFFILLFKDHMHEKLFLFATKQNSKQKFKKLRT